MGADRLSGSCRIVGSATFRFAPDTIRKLLCPGTSQLVAVDSPYQTFNPKEAIRYYDEALNFADNNHLEYEKAVIYQNKAEMCGLSGDYKQAIKILNTALLSASKTNHAKKGELIVKIYIGLSSNYRYANDPKKAVVYQLKGIAEAERLKMYSQLVKSYYNLSLIYKEMNEYSKQLDCSEKALEFAKKNGSREDLFIANIAISQSYIFLEDYKKAATNIKAAQKYYNALYAPAKLIGYHLRLRRGYSDAEKILKSSEADIAKTNETSQKLILLEYYSRLYKEWGKYDKALEYNVMNYTLGDSLASLSIKTYIATLGKKNTKRRKKEAQIKQLQDEKKDTAAFPSAKQTIQPDFDKVVLHHKNLALHRISELETEKQLAQAEAGCLKVKEQERARLAKDLHDGLGGNAEWNWRTMVLNTQPPRVLLVGARIIRGWSFYSLPLRTTVKVFDVATLAKSGGMGLEKASATGWNC
ncbi:hypothetical protein FQR65_LT15927 [Abscondita terminalis]|nr:hypothetical protein FQR65_LT15927 [Abscondita terminalis]